VRAGLGSPSADRPHHMVRCTPAPHGGCGSPGPNTHVEQTDNENESPLRRGFPFSWRVGTAGAVPKIGFQTQSGWRLLLGNTGRWLQTQTGWTRALGSVILGHSDPKYRRPSQLVPTRNYLSDPKYPVSSVQPRFPASLDQNGCASSALENRLRGEPPKTGTVLAT
jgi:hypothetical protein